MFKFSQKEVTTKDLLIPLFIKIPKYVFGHSVPQYDKNSAYSISFNVSGEKEWVSQYKKIWNEVESQLFEKVPTEPIKGKYVQGKLKTWKETIIQIFMVKMFHTTCIAMQQQC